MSEEKQKVLDQALSLGYTMQHGGLYSRFDRHNVHEWIDFTADSAGIAKLHLPYQTLMAILSGSPAYTSEQVEEAVRALVADENKYWMERTGLQTDADEAWQFVRTRLRKGGAKG